MEPTQPTFTANYADTSSKSSLDSMFPNWKKLLTLSAVVFIFMIIWTYLSSPMIVTVTGSGEVSVPATNATVSFSLTATDNSISGAVNSVSSKADSMRNYLKSKGVAEGDIAQSQVTAVPASLVSSGASGFQATISMAAKTTHVTDVNSLVTDLYSNGALLVAQPVLSVENQDALDQQAFNSALSDAKKQAGQVGLANWKFIRKIISITQVTSPTTSTTTTRGDIVTSTSASAIGATNGVFKIVKAVSVSFKMW